MNLYKINYLYKPKNKNLINKNLSSFEFNNRKYFKYL